MEKNIMKNQKVKPRKYPVNRITENQKKYNRLKEALNHANTGKNRGKSTRPFLLPLQVGILRLYFLVLIVTLIICILSFIKLKMSGMG